MVVLFYGEIKSRLREFSGISIMAVHNLPKVEARVRFSYHACSPRSMAEQRYRKP